MNMNDKNNPSILIVDDVAENRKLLTQIFQPFGYQIRVASNGNIALRSVLNIPPDIILLDVRMPGMDGFEVCKHLKKDESTQRIPIIFITASDDIEARIKGFDYGAVDYVTKPFINEELIARVKTQISLYKLQKQLFSKNELLEQEIEERKKVENKLKDVCEGLEITVAERTKDIKERLRFEELLSGLSTRLVQLPINAIENEINKTLVQLINFLNVDNISLLEYNEVKDELFFTHSQSDYNFQNFIGINFSQSFPWLNQKICKANHCEVISFDNIPDNIPDNKINDINHIFEEGIKSLLFIPLETSEKFRGGLFLCSFTQNSINYESYINRLRLVGEIFTNVLLRKRAVEDKKNLETQLHHVQKMESLALLAGGIAHDFNNILFPMLGHTEILMEEVSEKSSIYKDLSVIYKSGNRAKDLVNQILKFSRQNDPEQKPLIAGIIVKEVVKLIRSSLPASIEIITNIDEECGLINADPTHIHQISMNLITNAFHAMEKAGGKLYISLNNVDIKDTNLTIQNSQSDQYVCLKIRDTGSGIDKKIINQIFDPYFTTKPEGKGTGLGLSLVYSIIKSYSGDVQVNSEPGKGTEFSVYIPCCNSDDKNKKSSFDPSKINKQSLNGTECILIVDDDPIIANLISEMLSQYGYKTVSETNSKIAKELFKETPHKFDLLITDYSMPGLNGIHLSEIVSSIRSDLPILLMSGFNNQISDEAIKIFGINACLIKPIILLDLVTKVRQLLNKLK